MRAAAAACAVALLFAAPLPAQSLRHDLSAGPEVLLFEANDSTEGSVGARASGGLVWLSKPGGSLSLVIEPRGGVRVISFEGRTTAELIADARVTLGLRWQVYGQGKLRDLSDPPPLPAYLEPGRAEGWGGAIVSTPVIGRWMIEARASAGLVRYTPNEWRVLDRDAALGALSINHPVGPGVARLTLAGGGERYGDLWAFGREDWRWGVRFDWATSKTIFLQLEGGLAWNYSNIPGYDYRSGRLGLLMSAPLGIASAQVYGGLALKTYTDQGRPGARIAPSDRDTGSFIIVQATRSLSSTTSLHLRGEWSQSETGFRNLYYQRLGFSALFSFRPS
jgi:hypothetical protein